jgi:hypothetical protein
MNTNTAANDTSLAVRPRQSEVAEEAIVDTRRRMAIYYAWSRLGETSAPLEVIEDRFPALFEGRRMLYPRFAELADPARYDQGIGGFLDQFQRSSFVAFAELAATLIGAPVTEIERANADGVRIPITDELLSDVGTLVVISLDSVRTGQRASEDEIAALREFLDVPGNLLVVAPHHNIGDDPRTEFIHHGDRLIPPRQRFSGFARSILAGLDAPVENCFGLRPAILPDGDPAPIECKRDLDRLGLLLPTRSRRTGGPRSTRCFNPDWESSGAIFWWATRPSSPPPGVGLKA